MFNSTFLLTWHEKQWIEVLDEFNIKDPHYLPAYLRLFESEADRTVHTHFGGNGMLFVYGDSRNHVIYPFFKRSISDIPLLGNSAAGLFDIVSPYGYGGPLAQVEDESISEELWKGFFSSFDVFCRDSNIVSEFCRLHPMFENHIPISKFSKGTIQRKGRVLYVNLDRSEEEIIAGMGKLHRRDARRASRDPSLAFYIDNEKKFIGDFFNLYTETMVRHEAHRCYMFSLDFFKRACQLLGDHLTLSSVTHDGMVVSGLLSIRYGDLLYHWLAGGKREYFHLNTQNLLYYESILQAHREGYKYCIEGGGVSAEEDSVFKFKEGFSRQSKDFYVYKRIHLQEEYDKLVKLQRTGVNSGEDFFPWYRVSELVGV